MTFFLLRNLPGIKLCRLKQQNCLFLEHRIDPLSLEIIVSIALSSKNKHNKTHFKHLNSGNEGLTSVKSSPKIEKKYPAVYHVEAIFININAFSVSGFLFTSEGRGVTASHLS